MEDNINLSVASNTSELKLAMESHMIIHTDHVARLHLTHKQWSFIPAEDSNLSDLGPGCMVALFRAFSVNLDGLYADSDCTRHDLHNAWHKDPSEKVI